MFKPPPAPHHSGNRASPTLTTPTQRTSIWRAAIQSGASIDTYRSWPDLLFAADEHPADARVAPAMRGNRAAAKLPRNLGYVALLAPTEPATPRISPEMT
jgi:hypothetical protein